MGSQRTTWFPKIPKTESELVLNVDLVGLPLSKVLFDKVLQKLNNSGQPKKSQLSTYYQGFILNAKLIKETRISRL